MDKDTAIATHFLARQPCPYIPDGRLALSEHIRFLGTTDQLSCAPLIYCGWRRYGNDLYRMRCDGCHCCIPLRISASELKMTSSLKRILYRNRDLIIVPRPPRFSDEHLQLWREYSLWKHLSPPGELDEESYQNLYTPWSAIFEYRDGERSGVLLATSHIDLLPEGLSSVYFSFSLRAKSRSLGYYSMLTEAYIALDRISGCGLTFSPISGESILQFYLGPRSNAPKATSFYYLGFWIPGAQKMDYKARLRPFSLQLGDGDYRDPPHWVQFENRAKAIDYLRTANWPGL